MSDKIALDAGKIINHSIETFANLLKEFPKNAADSFVYDESTLKKIGSSGAALAKMAALLKRGKTSFGKIEKSTVEESYNILSRLMDEMPKSPADEFSYDRAIHLQVEEARQAIKKLSHLISDE